MMRRSSHRQAQKGLALFEVLVCVVLLSSGLIVIYQPLLASASALRDSEYRMVANRLMENQIWEHQEEVTRQRKQPSQIQDKILTEGKKVFYYTNTVRSFPDLKFYEVHSVISWQLGSREKSIRRMSYVEA